MINKRTADKILSRIKRSKQILLALHISPDGDSIASVLAMDKILTRLGKKVKIISPSGVNPRFAYLPGTKKIKTQDFAQIDFGAFDLFIALDVAQETKITRNLYPDRFPPGFEIINIDHHITNPKFGNINLVIQASSTSEILYWLFDKWGIKLDKSLSELLLLGMVTDTGCFQYPTCSSDTLLAAGKLMEKGASLTKTVLAHYRSYNFKTLKYWGKILDNLKMDESGKFVWSKVSREELRELEIGSNEIEGAASCFAPVIEGTEFGIIFNDEGELTRVSLRSRTDFDVSKIALSFGGGGHKQSAGFSIELPLKEAEEEVLKVVRKYVR